MSETPLTKEEQRAIVALQRLGDRWPKTLTIFAHGGELTIYKMPRSGEPEHLYGNEVGSISGIPNDGGDGGAELDHERRFK